MQCHRVVEILLGQFCLNRNRSGLKNFAAVRANKVKSNHALFGASYHHFVQCPFVPVGENIFHRPKIAFIHLDVIMLRTRFCFGQANASNGWVAEHRGGNALIVNRARVVSKYTVGKSMAFTNGNWR